MKIKSQKTLYKHIALALSLCILIVWAILGTGASLAWFSDSTPEINNIFHFADFKLEVSHQLSNGNWEKIDGQTNIFDNNALYEPGYTQVVYLKVENKGTVPFNFYTAVNVNDCSIATNVFGQKFLLQDYLKFGVCVANNETSLKNSIPNREAAENIANMPLHNYYESSVFELAPNTAKYVAIIVRMPKEVGNAANYKGEKIPKVELGITAKADQIKN